MLSPVLAPLPVTYTTSSGVVDTVTSPAPASIVLPVMNEEVVPVSTLTATAPATVTLLSRPPVEVLSAVEALLFKSVASLAFLPPLPDEPPAEEFATVVIVRSELDARVTALPSTVAPSLEAVVSP